MTGTARPAAQEELLLRGRLLTGGRLVEDGLLVVRGDEVAHAGPAGGWAGALPPAAPDRLLLPGLVDVHCHGGGGAGFPDDDAESLRAAIAAHRERGTTTLVASLVSAPPAVLRERIEVLAPLVAAGELAGVHLEGPFLSPAQRGAHDPAVLLDPDPDLLRDLLAVAPGVVVSMTLAPELPRAAELVAVLRAHGVLPSFGHTDADAMTTTAAVRAAAATGPVSATHLFNAMAPFSSRAPGPVAACLAAAGRGELVLELVADGVHLAPETVAAVFDLVGADQVALVTDAMAAAGMPDGGYRLGALPVRVAGGTARLVVADGGAGAIAGGTARLADVLRCTVRDAGVGLVPAVLAATRTPATLLGLFPRVGELAPGTRADVLVTDPDLEPVAVLRGGVWVHREET